MEIKIKNQYVIGLASWFNGLQLTAKTNEARILFVEQLTNVYKEFNEERLKIVDKYSEKDDKEEVIYEAPNVPKLIDKEKAEKEITELYERGCVFEMNDMDYTLLKSTLLNTNYLFGPKESDNEQEKKAKIRQAKDYVEWCRIFKNVEEDVEKNG